MRDSNPTAKGVCQTFRNWLRLAAFIPSPLQAPAQASSDARRCSPPLASALLTAPLNALLICSSHSPALTPPHPGPQLSGPSWRASRQLLSLLYHHLLISFSAATLSSPWPYFPLFRVSPLRLEASWKHVPHRPLSSLGPRLGYAFGSESVSGLLLGGGWGQPYRRTGWSHRQTTLLLKAARLQQNWSQARTLQQWQNITT